MMPSLRSTLVSLQVSVCCSRQCCLHRILSAGDDPGHMRGTVAAAVHSSPLTDKQSIKLFSLARYALCMPDSAKTCPDLPTLPTCLLLLLLCAEDEIMVCGSARPGAIQQRCDAQQQHKADRNVLS